MLSGSCREMLQRSERPSCRQPAQAPSQTVSHVRTNRQACTYTAGYPWCTPCCGQRLVMWQQCWCVCVCAGISQAWLSGCLCGAAPILVMWPRTRCRGNDSGLCDVTSGSVRRQQCCTTVARRCRLGLVARRLLNGSVNLCRAG